MPQTHQCACILPDTTGSAAVTIFSFGQHERIDRWIDQSGKLVIKRGKRPKAATRLQIEINNEAAGRTIRKTLNRYSFENDGQGLWWREHSALWEQILQTLKRHGLSHEKLECGDEQFTREAIESLIALCRQTQPIRRDEFHSLFGASNVSKVDRGFVASWLIKEFESGCKLNDQIGVRLWEQSVPAIADDLIGLIKDDRYGDERWPLALALAKTKDARAADVIITLLGKGVNTRGALEALGKLPAQKHASEIRKYLRDSDADVRREAKRTLKKLGFPIETPPPPVHLVKYRRMIPKGLEEWSTAMDIEDLAPVLQKLSKCVDSGFGKMEIAEVAAVADEMKHDQTRAFRFDARAGGEKTDLWMISTAQTLLSSPISA